MRYIVKGREHTDFTQWRAQQRSAASQNLNFRALPTSIKLLVVAQMLKEQGYLCAYTMLRIQDEHSCHIEHSQAQSTHPELDLDYNNMLACVPSGQSGTPELGYGATYRGNLPIESPTNKNIESRFHYDTSGRVGVSNSSDSKIEETITALYLNHDDLVALRKKAIETQGIGARSSRARSSQPRLDHIQARRLARNVLQPNPEGKLMPFCIAIAQVALSYAEKYEKRQQSIRAQHRTSR